MIHDQKALGQLASESARSIRGGSGCLSAAVLQLAGSVLPR